MSRVRHEIFASPFPRYESILLMRYWINSVEISDTRCQIITGPRFDYGHKRPFRQFVHSILRTNERRNALKAPYVLVDNHHGIPDESSQMDLESILTDSSAIRPDLINANVLGDVSPFSNSLPDDKRTETLTFYCSQIIYFTCSAMVFNCTLS